MMWGSGLRPWLITLISWALLISNGRDLEGVVGEVYEFTLES